LSSSSYRTKVLKYSTNADATASLAMHAPLLLLLCLRVSPSLIAQLAVHQRSVDTVLVGQ
jgi:hypothetical protein